MNLLSLTTMRVRQMGVENSKVTTALLLSSRRIDRSNSNILRKYSSFAGAFLALVSSSYPPKSSSFSSAFVLPSSPLEGVTATRFYSVRPTGTTTRGHRLYFPYVRTTNTLYNNNNIEDSNPLQYRGGGSSFTTTRRSSSTSGSTTASEEALVATTQTNEERTTRNESGEIMSTLTPAEKLDALRERMKELDLDVYLVPTDDPHLSGTFAISGCLFS